MLVSDWKDQPKLLSNGILVTLFPTFALTLSNPICSSLKPRKSIPVTCLWCLALGSDRVQASEM
jgi:hypothetical protein